MLRSIAVLLLLFALPVAAGQLDVRANDADHMHQVSDVACDLEVTFSPEEWDERGNFTGDFMGVFWGPKLAGMTEDCVGSGGAVRGSGPGGVTLPSSPLATVPEGFMGSRYYIVGTSPYFLAPVFGCGTPGRGPLAATFPEPVTALCMDYVFFKGADGSCTPGERLHQEFWDADGNHVGHQDVVAGGVPMTDNHNRWCLQSFCWESDVPVSGVTTWPQNGPGAMWNGICLGTAVVAPPPVPDPNVPACIRRCLEGICGP